MIARVIAGIAVAGLVVAGTSVVRAESKGCEQIVAANEEGGGGVSAEELAKKLHTDIETVRNCLDAAAKPAKPAAGAPAPKN